MLVSNKTQFALAVLSMSIISVNAQSALDVQPTARIGWGGDLGKAKTVSYDEVKPLNPYNNRPVKNYSSENNDNPSYSTSTNVYNKKSYTADSNAYNKVETKTPANVYNKSYSTTYNTDTYEETSKAYNKTYNSYNNSYNANAYNNYYKKSYNKPYNSYNRSYSNDYKLKSYNNSYNSSYNNAYNNSYNQAYNNSYNNSYNNYTTTYNNSHQNYYNKYSRYANRYNSYEKLAISTGSRGVMVYDLETGKSLYQKNANIARPIASVTKLMTAMVVLDAGLNMNESIQLEAQDFRCVHVTCKKSSSRLKVGDRLPRKDWLLMMLMKSENPAAKTLARHYPGGYSAFMRAMNRKARSLGMYNTFFGDPSGLDKRNKSSPNDLVKMVRAAHNYPKIRQYSTTPSHNFYMAGWSPRTYRGRSTSYLVRNKTYPITISKTGYIREAGRCMVMETQINNRPAIVVLLGANSYGTRNRDANNILMSLSSRYL